MSGISMRNMSGCKDPTAQAALQDVLDVQEKQDARITQLIYALKAMIDVADCELLARIEIRDKRTGRMYR